VLLPGWGSTHTDEGITGRGKAPREQGLPLRGLTNQSMIGYQEVEGIASGK